MTMAWPPGGVPWILVDVDGVLNVDASARVRKHLAYHEGWYNRHADADAAGRRVRLFTNPRFGGWLLGLARETGAELAWGSTWEFYANACVAPRVGLPPLPFAPAPDGERKAETVVPWTAGRPFVWFDDDTTPAAVAAVAGPQPHLVIPTDEHVGLTSGHIEAARRWLTALNTAAARG